MGPQGIFKPRVLPDLPLSITTVAALEARRARTTMQSVTMACFDTDIEAPTRASAGGGHSCTLNNSMTCWMNSEGVVEKWHCYEEQWENL